MIDRGLGYLKDAYSPDDVRLGVARSSLLLGSGELPEADLHLVEHAPPVMDQGGAEACFPAGARILMADLTEREIQHVGEGNEVFTHTGAIARVSAVSKRNYEGLLHHVELKGYPYPLTATPEHPLLIDKGQGLVWTPIKDVKPGDFVLMPYGAPREGEPQNIHVPDWVPDLWDCESTRVRRRSGRRDFDIPRDIPLDENFARLLGLFLAEGSYTHKNDQLSGLVFTFATEEHDYRSFVVEALKNILGAHAEIRMPRLRPSVGDVVCHNSVLAYLFLALCGRGALQKHLPSVIFKAPTQVRRALLRGWLEGDGTKKKVYASRGSQRKTTKESTVQVYCTGVTSSEDLHRGLLRLAYSCGLRPSGLVRSMAQHQNAEARTFDLYSTDVLELFPEVAKDLPQDQSFKTRRFKKHELGFLVRVKEVRVEEPEEPLFVYNLEVDRDEHSYIANGVAVHNCVGMTIACMGYVMQSADGVDGPVLPSPGFIWWNSRKSHSDEKLNMGTYMRNAFHTLRDLGIAPEKLCPVSEIDWKFAERPSHLAYQHAYDARFDVDFIRLDGSGDELKRQVKSCIVQGLPVGIGCLVSKKFVKLARHELVDIPEGDPIAGGHAMCVVGYDWQGVVVRNSWGPLWGNGGDGHLSWRFFTENWVDDVWALRRMPQIG
ncbi:MAG: hypothetical protein AMXMBFR56_82210 [Polyangiaceae bacterium]